MAGLRRAVANLLLLAISGGLALLLLEGATRLVGLHFPAIPRPEVQDGGVWVYDASKGWFHRPLSQGRADLGGPDRGLVRINSLGLRGPEPLQPKPPDLKRVLVLGDSYVFGVGVDEEHLFTTRLAQRLSRGGARVEAVTAGVSGYSNDQQLILLEELGPRLAPDLVVLVMCDNDFEGNGESFSYQQYYKPWFELAPAGELRRHHQPVPRLSAAQRARRWLGQRSNLWNLVRTRHSAWPAVQRAIDTLQVDVTHAPGSRPVELTAALVVAIRDLSERLGAGFLTVNTGRAREELPLFHRLRPLLQRQGVRYGGLEGPLAHGRARHPDWPWDFGGDPHWNVAAHRLAAEVVAEQLESAFGERLR